MMGAYGNLSKAELIERLERVEAELKRTLGERDRESWERDRKFRAVVESVVNGIVMVDEKGKIVFVNSRIEEFFGYPRDELEGQPIEILVPERAVKAHRGMRHDYAAHPEARSMGAGRHLSGRRKDGSEFPVEVGLSPVRTPEGMFILGVIIDITERKRLEGEVLEAGEREKRRIGEDIHDDLCQQLAGIGCMAKVLEKSFAADSKGGEEMVAKIGQLIGEAQVRARELARGLVTGSLRSEGICGALEELASSTESLFGVTCRFRCGEDLERRDSRFELQLYRIAQEAISNAVRHGEAGRIEVEIDARDGRVVLSVSDDGVGIRKDAQSSGGLGLLTMSHRAAMINGSLEIRGGKKGGTVVKVTTALPSGERAEEKE